MKRLSTADPLTADDVAERLNKALLRALKILGEVRQTDGDLYDDVRRSRHLIWAGEVRDELARWLDEPFTTLPEWER